ncbi:hypothetical protein [uncultured Sphaerochaeta sp.]|uniref:hypothetical protein n=1 Tax=uncultured Sphaerochaeta sp. TaxID=886478 RepID=UPI002AA7ADE7|nr:hypothetical protein [uncultured Sphaerochaeta sp.]
MNKKLILTLALLSFSALSLFAFSFTPFVETEQGTIGLLHHTFQNGTTGDEFDYIKQGGQNNLYPFSRYTVGARIEDKHRLWFTYQPLQLDTAVDFKNNNVKIGDKTFEGPMELTYSFPFYRATYTYDLLGKYEEAYLGVGLALQIRNASIQFREVDGEDSFISQNVGLVPALAIYSEYRFPFGLTLSADIAGSYANLAYINGADYTFEGSILDASLRMDYAIEDGFSLFANARFFGGTADGESENDASNWTESTEVYTKNNIASLTFSAGLAWQMQ